MRSLAAVPLLFAVLSCTAQVGTVPVRDEADRAQQLFDRTMAGGDGSGMRVEQHPLFPGGEAGLRRFVVERSRYPPEAMALGITGRVHVRFVVEQDGRVDSVTVLRGVHPLLDAEAMRVVRLADGWEPGRMNGMPVRVALTVPVTFHMDPEKAQRRRRRAAR